MQKGPREDPSGQTEAARSVDAPLSAPLTAPVSAAMLWTLAVLALGAAAWLWAAAPLLDPRALPAWAAGGGVLVLHGLLALWVGRALEGATRKATAYRAGFLASLGGAALASLAWQLASQTPGWWPFMLAVWSGAAAGSLALSGADGGLWEDNFPPPEFIQAEVLEWHRAQIGLAAPVPAAKRVFDIVLALAALLASLPLTLAAALLIWLEDPGPVLFIKNSVGRGGVTFRQLKFRTMERDAERETGPVLARENDPRLLHTGQLMRKTGFDELPQLVNILLGQMSIVGPRPQRTVLVHGYLQSIPGYAERHRVAPGLTGLAQVSGSYYLSPEEKLAWDRRYIAQASLWTDIQLILRTVKVAVWGKVGGR